MAQSAEEAALRIAEGHGTNTGHGIADPGTQLILAVGTALGGLGGKLDLLVVPHRPDAHGLAAYLLEYGLDFFNAVHLLPVDVGDDVALFQAAVAGGCLAALGGGHLTESYHHHAVGKQLDAHGTTHRDHLPPLLRGSRGLKPGHAGHQHHRGQERPHPGLDLWFLLWHFVVHTPFPKAGAFCACF